MAEYIEREAALIAIKNLYPSVPFTKLLMERWHKENKAYMECEMAIEKLHAADVRPVVRGKWSMEDDGTLFYRCSACGKPLYGCFAEIYMGNIHFCPNCGAEMEES